MSDAAERMPQMDALRALHAALRADDVVITSMGAARDWMVLGAGPLDLPLVPSSMGTAPAIGLGIAVGSPLVVLKLMLFALRPCTISFLSADVIVYPVLAGTTRVSRTATSVSSVSAALAPLTSTMLPNREPVGPLMAESGLANEMEEDGDVSGKRVRWPALAW